MSDNKARGFLDYILAHPDDDAPRLVFADWLEEHGDSDRAEFIRVQIERARLPQWDARQVRLRLRERELIARHEKKWKRELPRIRGVTWDEFRRGFVATATFARAVLQTKAGDCWAATPLEAVSVRWPHRREAVDSITPIAGLRELTLLGSALFYDEIDQLAAAPLLSTLRVLNILECELETDGFRRLLTSPHLGNLTALRAPSNYIGNGGIRALLDAVSLTSLQELDLSEENNYGRYGEDPIIEAVGIEALTTWPGMNRLRSLNLSGNSIGSRGLRTLLHSPRAAGLKELFLGGVGGNGLFGKAMQEFGTARAGLQLDVLDLTENVLGDHGAACLAKAACLSELKVLELNCCEIELSGARRLAKATFLAGLRRLHVNYNNFGSEGLLALLEAKPPELHTLHMGNNDLGYEGIAYLAESTASDVLLDVNLDANGLKKKALQALAKSNHLRNLLVLRLNDNPFSMATGVELEDSPFGKRLAILEL